MTASANDEVSLLDRNKTISRQDRILEQISTIQTSSFKHIVFARR